MLLTQTDVFLQMVDLNAFLALLLYFFSTRMSLKMVLKLLSLFAVAVAIAIVLLAMVVVKVVGVSVYSFFQFFFDWLQFSYITFKFQKNLV